MRPMRDASLSKHGQHRGAGRRALPLLVLIWLLLAWMAPARQTLAAAPLGDPVARTGRLTVKWGDGRSGSSSVIFTLSAKGQGEAQVLIDAALARRHGGIVALDRRRVTIRGRWVEADGPGPRAIRAEAIEPAPNTNESSTDSEALAGSQPWINALCKFADVSSEPRDPGYFDGLVGETAPGLGHYWREASYESLSILGSGSSGWYTLPETRSYYLSLSSSQMLNELFADCTAAADSAVDFSGYHGLNLMFNDELDGSAWGGSVHATLDGESRFWPTTWLPPWAYGNQAVVAHEMGHGFGLPHSSGDYGLTYDNQWDVMSDTWSNCARASDPTYGCLGQHTIAHHKDMLEWIPEALQYQASEGVQTVTLERLALPETDSYRIAVIPIDDSTSHFYTVEARNWAGYDVKLPGEAVIIHEVDTTRSRPAHVVDVDGNGDTGDEGAMWVVGETFSDPDHQIHVAVDSASLSGYTITITLGDVLPTRTPTETATPTVAATSTSTPTQTPTPTDTPSPTATDTQMPPTATSTSTDTPEPTPTHTPEPTDTPSPTATDTPVPPTATPTSTETPEPTATHTPAPTDKPDPTNTPEPTDTPTSTATPQPTETAQATDTPPPTATDTPAPTDTYTPQPTSTHTPQPTATCPPPAFSESRGKSKGRFGDSPPFEVAPNSPCFQPPGPRQPIPWLFEKLSEDLDWLKSIVRILGRF